MDNSMDIEMWDCACVSVQVCICMLANGEKENEHILLILQMWKTEGRVN